MLWTRSLFMGCGLFDCLCLGLIKKGDLEQAEKILERGYIELLRRDAAFFQAIPKNKLTSTLIGEHNFENGHLAVLAELFFAEATLCEAQQKPSYALINYEKALILLEFLEEEDKTWSAKRDERITLLKTKISQRITPLN